MSQLYECRCKCTLFEEIKFIQIEKNHVSVSPGMSYEAFAETVPVLKCAKCGKIHWDNISMYGIRYDSPDIAAHKELVGLMKNE